MSSKLDILSSLIIGLDRISLTELLKGVIWAEGKKRKRKLKKGVDKGGWGWYSNLAVNDGRVKTDETLWKRTEKSA